MEAGRRSSCIAKVKVNSGPKILNSAVPLQCFTMQFQKKIHLLYHVVLRTSKKLAHHCHDYRRAFLTTWRRQLEAVVMATQNDAPEQHVPAWKKLGLKLKYAQENSEPVVTNHSDIANEKKRKRASDKDPSTPDESVKNPKKKKTNVEKVLESTSDAPNSDTLQPSSRGDVTSPPNQQAPSRAAATRKSVSFTPDTKKTDGDSVKQYQTWLNSHEAKNSSFDPSAYSSAVQVTTSHTNPSPTLQTQSSSSTTKKSGKGKRSRRSKNASQQSNGQGQSEEAFSSTSHQSTLDYLFTYHTSDSPWKFSKTRQSHLLRHLFSPGFIPSSYYLIALEAYLSGLQGEGAKIRLRQAARKVQAEESSQKSESQDRDDAGAHEATEDFAQRGPSQTKLDLNSKDEEKKQGEEKEKEKTEDVPPKPDLKNPTPIPPRQIADLVLRIIGNDDAKDTDNDNEISEAKEEKEEKEETKKQQQQKPESKTQLKTQLNHEPIKKKPSTKTSTTTNNTATFSQTQPQPYKKRIRKHKARVSPPDDEDDDDDDESSDSSSSS